MDIEYKSLNFYFLKVILLQKVDLYIWLSKYSFDVVAPLIICAPQAFIYMLEQYSDENALVLARLYIKPFMHNKAMIELQNSILGHTHKKTEL